VCKVTSGSGTVEHYKNPNGRSPSVYLDSNRAVGFSNINVSYTNGVVTCSFRRMKTMKNIPNYFEISRSKTYYGLFAVGSFSGGNINFSDGKILSIFLFFYYRFSEYSHK
jgi:hypothetical protein